MRLVNSSTFTMAWKRGLFETVKGLCSLALDLVWQCYQPLHIVFMPWSIASNLICSLRKYFAKTSPCSMMSCCKLLSDYHSSCNKEGKEALLSHLSTVWRHSFRKLIETLTQRMIAQIHHNFSNENIWTNLKILNYYSLMTVVIDFIYAMDYQFLY